jgi:hypothetical protein
MVVLDPPVGSGRGSDAPDLIASLWRLLPLFLGVKRAYLLV